MEKVILGRTGLSVCKNGFGALPIQRIPVDEAGALLEKALDGGIDFFDTARVYSDSEEKIGLYLGDKRDRFVLATKTTAQTAEGFWTDLHTSLRQLQTDHIDLYQFHTPPFCPKPDDGSGLYEAMIKARGQGKIRFIGITNHRLHVAREAVASGLYDTLQFPFSYLSSEEDEALVALCQEKKMGFIAMKALSGGLITSSAAAYAYLAQFPGVLPIWGVQRESELLEFLSYQDTPPLMNAQLKAIIAKDRDELRGGFCRGCGYCLPCPAEIDIPTSARMSLLLRRSPPASYLTPAWQERMERIENCIHCGNCQQHCPYGLDTPALLHSNLLDYRTFLPKK